MKKAYLGSLLLLGTLSYAQVGIKTSDPKSTLDVTATNSTGSSSNVDGLLVPRVDRQRAQSMTGTPTSTMVFINSVSTGTQTGTTVNVDAVGYYFFNGSIWVKLDNPNNSSSASVNIYNSDGSLTGNRVVTQGANTLAFNGTAANAFSVDGTTLSVDAAGDRVGVGTTTPGVKLDVAQAIGTSEATQLRILNTSPTAVNNTAYIGFNSYNGGGATWGMGSIQNSATPTDNNFHILYSSGGLFGKFFTIRPNTGNTGIGTATPQKRLHVNGDLQFTGELNAGGTATTAGSAGTIGQILTSSGAGAAPVWQTPVAAPSVNIYNSDGTLTGNRVVTQGANTLAFNGTAANAFSVDGNTLSVDAAGDRVGVGTTTPGVKLDVAQAIGTSEATQFRIINTSPVATNNTALMGFNSYNGGGATWGMGSVQNSATPTDNNFHILYSSGGLFGKVFTIRPNTGNTGIGTTTPQKKLHVNGDLQITSELNVGGNATTAGNAGTAGQLLTSSGAGAAPKWTNSPIDADGTVNIANVAHHVINVNSEANGTYVLDQTNAPNYTIWVTHPRTSGCDVQLPDPTTQQRRVVNIVAANDTQSVRVCGAPLFVTGTTTINVIPAGKRVIIGASNIFGAIWYVTMKDF